MQVNSAVNSAMFGYQKASENQTSSAQNIATVTANSGMASLKVLDTADEILGTTIDVSI